MLVYVCACVCVFQSCEIIIPSLISPIVTRPSCTEESGGPVIGGSWPKPQWEAAYSLQLHTNVLRGAAGTNAGRHGQKDTTKKVLDVVHP